MEPRIFRPHPKQEVFATLPDSIFEALYGGAAGGGKSDILMMLPLIRRFHEAPRFKGLYMRRTYSQLEEIIIRTQQWFKGFGGKWNDEKKRWVFPSGAVYRFGHAEHEQDIRKYDSDEYTYIAFDELTSFTAFQYDFLAHTRCRTSDQNLPALVRAATNPGNIGHAWVRALFVEPNPDGGVIIVDKRTKLKRIFIKSLLADNPHLNQADPLYRQRLEALPESERRAKLDGDWYTFEGQVFDDYRDSGPLTGEPENANHICKPFDIPNWWLRFLSIDWGYKAMTCAHWTALSPDNRLYVYREYAKKEAKTSEWATDIGNLSRGEKYVTVVLCRSAWQNRGDELTIQEKFKAFSGLEPSPADNGRIAGKLMLQEYLRWKPAPTIPQQDPSLFSPNLSQEILRKEGSIAHQKYLALFEVPKEAVLPKLQIFPDCKELRTCLPLCIYAKSNNQNQKSSEDVREFEGDDPYDTIRYNVCAADAFVNSQTGEATKRRVQDTIVNQFQETQDWTTYHIRMSMLKQGPSQRPIRRFGLRSHR